MTNRPETDEAFEAWATANGFGQSQATSWARAAWVAAVASERERCARIAREGCLVPPDGGSPTEDERLLCDEIARRILA